VSHDSEGSGAEPADWSRLSAASLDDIPDSVRIGSPYDASDEEVLEAARVGFVHPQTNYGVVYRIAFAPRLEPREEPITMRVMFATTCPASQGLPAKPTIDDAAWLVVTSRALRWHFCLDGVPGMATGIPPAGPREAEYVSLTPAELRWGREVVSAHAGPFGSTSIDFFGFHQDAVEDAWLHAFGLSPGYETDALMNEIHERIAFAKG
jgi:hypothetical protein